MARLPAVYQIHTKLPSQSAGCQLAAGRCHRRSGSGEGKRLFGVSIISTGSRDCSQQLSRATVVPRPPLSELRGRGRAVQVIK